MIWLLKLDDSTRTFMLIHFLHALPPPYSVESFTLAFSHEISNLSKFQSFLSNFPYFVGCRSAFSLTPAEFWNGRVLTAISF